MTNEIPFYIGGAMPLIWGISHLFPTKNIVKGFGEISQDNRHIITMEWITEAVALIFTGVIVIGVTLTDPANNVSAFVYISSAVVLLVLAVVSLFTGFKIKFIAFKLCPFLFSASAVLIILGYVF